MKVKSTVGFVGSEGVILKDHSDFKKGDLVIVIAEESFEDLFNKLTTFKKNLEKSKKWVDEIKDIKGDQK